MALAVPEPDQGHVEPLQERYALREAAAVADEHPGRPDASCHRRRDEHLPEGRLASPLLGRTHVFLGPRAPHPLGVSGDLSGDLRGATLGNAEVDLPLYRWDLHDSGVPGDWDRTPQHGRGLSR